MGICSSCESTPVSTAKLILQDGQLQEFKYPVKVSYVLQKNPACFICNSDEMDFDDILSAISDDEELQLGQLYFALPLSRLKYPLQAEEMAALAVKANSALTRGGGDKCGCHRNGLVPVVFSGKKEVGLGGGGLVEKRRRSSGGGKKRNSTSNLSAIPE